MRAAITQSLIGALKPGSYDIWDTVFPGLALRVRPNGRHSYLVRPTARDTEGHSIRNADRSVQQYWWTLGQATRLTPTKARTLARDALAQAEKADLRVARRRPAGVTLEVFLTTDYGPHVMAQHRDGAATLARLRACFPELLPLRLTAITAFAIDRWRSARRKAGISVATINRDLNPLKAALAKAVEWHQLKGHPLSSVKPGKVDRLGRLRFLTAAEEQRLRGALLARDERRRREREQANAWRRERHYQEHPTYNRYTDHVTPIVLTALNTGLRRGELLALRWAEVDLTAKRLTVRGASTKSGTTRRLPLNSEVVEVLTAWRPARPAGDALVFPGRTGDSMTTLKTAWGKLMTDATITGFRFHDLRHTFASRLVEKGVDLNTVRELLGHATITMTLRYAHLKPENLATAVEKLVGAR